MFWTSDTWRSAVRREQNSSAAPIAQWNVGLVAPSYPDPTACLLLSRSFFNRTFFCTLLLYLAGQVLEFREFREKENEILRQSATHFGHSQQDQSAHSIELIVATDRTSWFDWADRFGNRSWFSLTARYFEERSVCRVVRLEDARRCALESIRPTSERSMREPIY